ncbi:Oplophorus-luciferin 2-monooxygenase non-catalytic subunit [Chionoecetes opilio]|uniref:Oplophorus-luciferin 2-monooxygenase non-catalytic subunit n=1 Tax=Chionoecetes opilio TaxID=41210 RepID=A0A8J5D4X0_CHIOP|nr:Oplophorus-luciferin 2-monooxygenase non-catalytic subunit [Chionoecetes opilio]
MRLLLMVAVVAAAAAGTARGSPCPVASSIYPCLCSDVYIGGKLYMDLDCSAATSNAVLANAFSGTFPFKKFTNLTIHPTVAHPALISLDGGVFGDVYFQNILVGNTDIRTVNEEALAPSHDSLILLDISDNRIESFPFEALLAFQHLRILDLSYNKLAALPNLETNSLIVLDLSGNLALTFSQDTFSGSPRLEEIYLTNMGLTAFPPNVFSSLNLLEVIDLSHNRLSGKLDQGSIRVPLDSLMDLRLNNNELSQIDPTAITGHTTTTAITGKPSRSKKQNVATPATTTTTATGVNRDARINFQNNKIFSLDWNTWFPLLDQLSGAQVVDLRGNPLLCGCDLVWLFLDTDELAKIHDGTTCYDGRILKSIDVNDLLAICS